MRTLALLLSAVLLFGGCSSLTGSTTSSSTDTTSSFDELAPVGSIASAQAFSTEENIDADAEDDVLEYVTYFEGPNGESVYNPGKDWSITVTIYDSEDSSVEGPVLYEKTFGPSEVQYDDVEDPFVRVPITDLKAGTAAYGWSMIKFSSPTHGDFSAREDYTTTQF